MNVPLLHVIATDRTTTTPGFLKTAQDMLEAGRERIALHLRLRRTSGRDFFELARLLSGAAADTGSWCVVNGRVDVAMCAGAQAVQLGCGALPVDSVRSLAGTRLFVGASVHSAEEAGVAADNGADYVVAGSVFRTATHPDRDPQGPGLVSACTRSGLPVIGIGGIDAGNAARVWVAGAAGIAVVRAVWNAAEPVEAATDLISRLPG